MRSGAFFRSSVICLLCVGFWFPLGCSAKRSISSAGNYGFEEAATSPASDMEPAKRAATVPAEAERVPQERTSLVPPPMVPQPAVAPAPPIMAQQVPEPVPERAPEPVPSAPPMPPAKTTIGSLADIYFDFDRFGIKKEFQAVLQDNAAWIAEHPEATIVIEGHCDERGTAAYNLILGEKRAKAAKRYLEELGIAPERLKAVSLGEIRPFCTERIEGCYRKNRRAHFTIQ